MIQYIDDNPGANISQIRRRINISYGSCAYHLHVLERSGEVRRVVQAASVRYYPAGYKLDAEALPPLSYLQRQILAVVLEAKSATFSQVLRKLESDGATITDKNLSYHLRVLTREKNLLGVRRDGRRAEYFVEEAHRSGLERRLKEESGVDEALETASSPERRRAPLFESTAGGSDDVGATGEGTPASLGSDPFSEPRPK
jgi:predicted transcriptional regulator